ncbi:MAG: type II/IV secretion system protein, partial [Pedosphaera sp.]|nr:type II/IV secretion system protein [Pedosphaera sp.]
MADADLATPVEFLDLTKEWRVAAENGSEEPLLAFVAREKGLAEDVFLERLAKAMSLRFVDLKDISPSAEARKRVTTKVAFQHFVLPIHAENGTLEVA